MYCKLLSVALHIQICNCLKMVYNNDKYMFLCNLFDLYGDPAFSAPKLTFEERKIYQEFCLQNFNITSNSVRGGGGGQLVSEFLADVAETQQWHLNLNS